MLYASMLRYDYINERTTSKILKCSFPSIFSYSDVINSGCRFIFHWHYILIRLLKALLIIITDKRKMEMLLEFFSLQLILSTGIALKVRKVFTVTENIVRL